MWNNTGNIDREISLYESLKKKYDINFIFFTYGNKVDKQILEIYGDFKIVTFGEFFKTTKFLFLKTLLIPFIIKNKKFEIDIIKCIQLNGSWVGIILKLITNKPLLIKTGFDQFIFSIKEKKSLAKRVLFYLITQIALITSNLYSVASKMDIEFINKYYFLLNKSNLIQRPNWVKVLEKSKFDNKFENKLLTVGRLSQQKNFFYMIDLLIGTNIQLDIIGSGYLKEEILNYANLKNVKVNLLGNIKNDELINLLRTYRYFINTSIFEGNPKAILEAMSAGCVVLVSAIPNNEEIVENNVNGFTIKLNGETNQVLNIINNVEENKLYELIGQNAINYVKQNNSFEKYIDEEYNDYKLLLKR